jgi:acyl-CoA synthetase (AMP-forming)/AMP-acid ligase II
LIIALLCGVKQDDTYWQTRIKSVQKETFDALAVDLFNHQSEHNAVYGDFVRLLKRSASSVNHITDIPFLPITFFRTHRLVCGAWEPEQVFRSSGTTGQITSGHALKSHNWYRGVAELGFQSFLGSPGDYTWLALLPGYLERPDSSLVAMVSGFMATSGSELNGFYLDDFPALNRAIRTGINDGRKLILLGVTHALLQFARQFPENYGQDLIIIETGGMKGHGPELVREEVHARLKRAFGMDHISSEYGMTEMLSQAWSAGNGRFYPAPTLKVTTRDLYDPYAFAGFGKTGVLCFYDLANYATQCFVQTGDLGRVYADGSFEILGRIDGSEQRGCNLMARDILDNFI